MTFSSFFFQAQIQLESQYYTPPLPHAPHSMYPSITQEAVPVASAPLPYSLSPQSSTVLYPSLNDYMGLELTPEMIASNMPEYSAVVAVHTPVCILNIRRR